MSSADQPDRLKFSFDDLTVGQVEYLEDETGKTITELMADAQDGKFNTKFMRSMIVVALQIEQPGLSVEDAVEQARNTKFLNVPELFDFGDDTDEDADTPLPSPGG